MTPSTESRADEELLGPSYSVWVVEDGPVTRRLFAAAARSRGHEVREFRDTESAIEAFGDRGSSLGPLDLQG